MEPENPLRRPETPRGNGHGWMPMYSFSCRLLVLVLAAAAFCTAAAAQDEPRGWYEAEALNQGLDTLPEGVDLSTPRSAMRTFIEASDRGNFQAAAHVLNLSTVDAREQRQEGPPLARQLYEVFERHVWIDWSGLPSRPDAKTEKASANSGQGGEVRRDLGIKLFEIDGRAYEIRLARFKSGDNDPVWMFTPQTVDDVPALHEAFGPRAFERFIPRWMKQELGGLRIWEWGAIPLMLALLGGIGWLVNRLVSLASRRLSQGFLQSAIGDAGVPLALFAMAGVAQVVLALVVSFSGPVTSIVRPVLVVVMASGAGIAALRVVDAVLDRITRRYVGEIDDTRSMDRRELYTSIYALRRIIVLLMVGFALLYVLVRLNLFESVGMTLLASAGVLTVLLGIAGQAVLGNILASLQIALAKPVRIGDSVLFEGEWAYVESIFYTFMRLRNWDERRIIVPVRHFVSKPFENWSVKDARMMRTIRLVLDHSADTELLRREFSDLARQDEDVIEPDQLACHVTSHSDRGQELTFYVMTPDPSTGWQIEMRLREALLAFVRENHPQWWPRDRIDGPDNRAVGAPAPD